ncbi:hypothetical protein ACFWM1_31685 [Nocardia sp. NPDC058379]|uniref:hypothetical protein n=1 Tax=unclassified Nocardia TaxID=2637762 RepID=UPI003658790F
MTLRKVFARYRQYRIRRFRKLAQEAAAIAPSWCAQRRRRQQVRVLVVILAVMFVSALALPVREDPATLVWVLAMALFNLASIPLDRVMGGQSVAPVEVLQEWEIQQRNAARGIGLTVTVRLSLIPVFWLSIVGNFVDGADYPRVVRGCAILLLTILVIGAYLPTLVLAWTRPDADPADRRPHRPAPLPVYPTPAPNL